ncbi:MAG TPA: hypothetical protein VFW62_06340, partial [bacterium]|nr:hypothetical protein [bacterium]
MTSSIQILSGRESAEWASLQRERDPELRAQGLLNLAGRLETQNHEAQAAAIYQILVEEGSMGAEQAGRRLQVLQGGGALGAQAERLSRQFFSHATDPALLAGMGVATLVASATRFGILARLATARGSLATRGFGARLLAGSGALALEAPAFTVTGRAANAVLGRPQDPSLQAWGHELAAGYLMLGSLKVSGGVARAAGGGPLLHQAGMFTGLMAAHGLEIYAGLRESRPFADLALESLSTLWQLHVAGGLSRSLLGTRYAGFLRELELRTKRLEP